MLFLYSHGYAVLMSNVQAQISFIELGQRHTPLGHVVARHHIGLLQLRLPIPIIKKCLIHVLLLLLHRVKNRLVFEIEFLVSDNLVDLLVILFNLLLPLLCLQELWLLLLWSPEPYILLARLELFTFGFIEF